MATRQGVKTGESKAQRFERLANARVNRATKDLRAIGNLANTSSYEFTPYQARKIVEHLRRELRNLEGKFAGKKQAGEMFEL